MNLPDNLKELRKQSGITQGRAAEILNIKRARYAAWEEGKAQPDIPHLLKLMEVYNVTFHQLIGIEPVSLDFTAKYHTADDRTKRAIDHLLT